MTSSFRRLALVVALSPAAAMAGDLSYNYIEGGAALYPSASDDQSFVGFDTRGSVELNAIHPQVFAIGGIKYLTDDFDYTAIHFGGAYRHSLDQRTDIWGGITLEYQDFDPGGDDMAPGLRGGLRHQLDPRLELGTAVRVITGDFDYVGVAGTARYQLNQDLAFLGEIDVQDGDFGLIGGVTFEF